MSLEYFDRFNIFCNTFQIRYYEQGYFKGDDWKYNDIIAPYNRLYIILDGEGIIELDDRSLILEKGNAYLIPAGVNFSCDSPLYLEKLYCHFLIDKGIMSDFFHDCKDILTLDLQAKISNYKTFHEALITGDIEKFYYIKSKYEALIYQFIDHNGSKRNAIGTLDLTPTMQDLLILIEQNLNAQLKTTWLAEQVGMTSSTLSKYYKKHMNRNIKHDLTVKLLQKGKIMLLTTEKSIQQIAYALGYIDCLYFSKVFRKNEGMTPTEYRRKNQIYYR